MKYVRHITSAAAIAMLGCASFAIAAEAPVDPSWYVQPSLNAVNPDIDFGTDRRGYGAGLALGRALSDSWDIQIGATTARSRDHGDTYRQHGFNVDGLYLISRGAFRPFLFAGAGAEYDNTVVAAFNERARTSPTLSAGVGFQLALTERFALQGQVRAVRGFMRSDALPHAHTYTSYATFGLNYALSKPATVPVRAPETPLIVRPEPMANAAPAPLPPVKPAPPAPAHFEKTTLSATELFQFDSALLGASQPKLDRIAAALEYDEGQRQIIVAGYADRIGSDAYNLALSTQRAQAVKSYLVGKGVAATRVAALGKGESNPIVMCATQKKSDLVKCLEPNRRVEVEELTIERRVR